jgi:hypothetical protein
VRSIEATDALVNYPAVVIPIPENKYTFQLCESCRDSIDHKLDSINSSIQPNLRSSHRGAFTGSNVHLFPGIGINAQLRVAFLKRCDLILDMITPQKLKEYSLAPTFQAHVFSIDNLLLASFSKDYGYFSSSQPIIAHVSDQQRDLDLLKSLFKDLTEAEHNADFVSFALSELFVKALAYRDLSEGQRIELPVQKGSSFDMKPFTVDRIFNLWSEMPAYGLIPDEKGDASLLLFRGTDFALYSKRGWASLLSDADRSGPGFSVFMNARTEIHEWLDKVSKEGKKAIVCGFSLGGALAAYTFIYERDLLRESGSVAFNAPGLSESVAAEWNRLSFRRQQGFISYVTRGDIISKIGILFGPTYELSTEMIMRPLFAHTALMSGFSTFTMALIDIDQENAQRRR